MTLEGPTKLVGPAKRGWPATYHPDKDSLYSSSPFSTMDNAVIYDDDHDDDDDAAASVSEYSHETDSQLNLSSGHDSHNTPQDSPKRDKAQLDELRAIQHRTKKETHQVQISRALTVFMIVCAASVVSAGTFAFLEMQEHEEFTNAFELHVQALSDDISFQVRELYASVKDMSVQITKEATIAESAFPFVTVPQFEVTAAQVRESTGLESIYWGPLIQKDQYDQWQTYAVSQQEWINSSRNYHLQRINSTFEQAGYSRNYTITGDIINLPDANGVVANTTAAEVIWQMSPPNRNAGVMAVNILSFPGTALNVNASDQLHRGVFSGFQDYTQYAGDEYQKREHDALHAQWVENVDTEPYTHPHATLVHPIFESLTGNKEEIVGHVFATFSFDRYLSTPPGTLTHSLTAVVTNNCGDVASYSISSAATLYLGPKSLHHEELGARPKKIAFYNPQDEEMLQAVPNHCLYTIEVSPTREYYDSFKTGNPELVTLLVVATFGFIICVFMIFDWFVTRRNSKILDAAARSSAIVSSLFPSNVRDRLFRDDNDQDDRGGERGKLLSNSNNKNKVAGKGDDMPIADLFPDTTVFFADIAGFTAWSSTREPTQVFVLLETIYNAFDSIANRRRVFKVETIGDCYVAATGLPDPMKDHAVTMARFAVDALTKMKILTKKLEVTLGPDTSDLALRVGIHSGPVTAGVLRGERSRFQLFGDTMNTASRMESNGVPNKIQLSQETANLLEAAGKGHWVTPREDKIVAKGKGELQTFWLSTVKSSYISSDGGSSGNSSDIVTDSANSSNEEEFLKVEHDDRTNRLIKWNVEIVSRVLRKLAASRKQIPSETVHWPQSEENAFVEVQDVINFPCDTPCTNAGEDHPLPPVVEHQLSMYITNIASMYRPNYFHNFEHASHVTMSVVKLLSRISSADKKDRAAELTTESDYATSIAADPLVQIACVFSALIHDVDHRGVPNSRLCQEKPELATLYHHKSVAEQNSVDLGWELFQDSNFADLRQAICATSEDAQRFRQLVVNAVMATDIMDKELTRARNLRWKKAFDCEEDEETNKEDSDRKATIVIEHLIQASDVAHTMQHWHIYRKWNERLFKELYQAYQEGRADTDPSVGWYQGEIGFFDFYIIPLAKKLRECKVFGVSSDEYLTYARHNRKEWEQRGKEIVAEMMENITDMEEAPSS